MPLIGLFILIAIIIGATSWFSIQASKKRTEAFRLQSEAMSLQFDPDGGDVRERLSDFRLMTVGRGQRSRNLLSGDAGDVKISIFDYQYTTGSGKNSRTTLQTVAALESASIHSPAFSMREQSALLDRIGKFFGGQDIDFEEFPKFSEMFVLKGPNEEAVRRFFTPKLLTFFETKVGHSVEGGQGKIVLYKAGRRVAPEDIKDLLAAAYEVYGHIVDTDAVT